MNLTEWATTTYKKMAGEWLTKHLASIPEQESLFRYELTPAESRRYRTGKASMADLLPNVLARAERRYTKEHEATCNRIAHACSMPEPYSIEMNVQWKRNRTWGMNPHADVTVRGEGFTDNGEGKASGCGYDKESTAVAEACNQCPMLTKVVLECAYRDYLENTRTTGYYFDSCGAVLEGGMGMGTIRAICERAGLTMTHTLSGKSYDTYIFDRK